MLIVVYTTIVQGRNRKFNYCWLTTDKVLEVETCSFPYAKVIKYIDGRILIHIRRVPYVTKYMHAGSASHSLECAHEGDLQSEIT